MSDQTSGPPDRGADAFSHGGVGALFVGGSLISRGQANREYELFWQTSVVEYLCFWAMDNSSFFGWENRQGQHYAGPVCRGDWSTPSDWSDNADAVGVSIKHVRGSSAPPCGRPGRAAQQSSKADPA